MTLALQKRIPHMVCLLWMLNFPSAASAAPRRRFQKVVKERSQLQHEVDWSITAPDSKKEHVALHRLEASPSLDVEVASGIRLKSAFRARLNVPKTHSEDESYDVDARALAIEGVSSWARLSLGLQEISWGETFGMAVADVVNPRDFREPLYFDASRTRIPLFMANLQLFAGDWDMQLIGVPLPRTRPDMADYRWMRDGEGGGRMGYRLGGLALQAQYYLHWNREPVVVLRGTPKAPVPNWYQQRVQTMGLSFSDGFEAVVLRGDFMMHKGIPVAEIQPFAEPARRDQFQSIFGIDWSGDSGWTLSAQYHNNYWPKLAPAKYHSNFHWAGLRYGDSFARNLFEVSAFALIGINTKDLWVKPVLAWNASSEMRVELEGSLLEGDKESEYPQLFNGQSHIILRTSYSY